MESPNKADALRIVSEELEGLRQRIIANHISANQVASGRTKASLVIEMGGEGGVLYGRFPFGTLETGRKGGNVPKNFADIIRQWIIDKGISVSPIKYVRKPSERWQPKYTPEERGLRSLAGAIAHKIAESGTELYREGGRNDIYTPEISKTLERIEERISMLFVAEIDNIPLN